MKRREFLKTAGAVTLVMAAPKSLWANLSGKSEQEIESMARDIVARMTLDEKIEQMAGVVNLQHTLKRWFDPVDASWIQPGNKKYGVPPLITVDGPRGVGGGRPTCFPVGMCRGATWDDALEEKVGEAIGYEGRAEGYNTVLSPCINVLRHPSWGRAQETYGEDPLHLGRMGAAHVRGLQQHVLSSPKHFAANSIENSRFFVNVKMDERTLREIYLPQFKACVDAGCATLMSAYNDLNGHLCGQNHHLSTEILREEWGFKYILLSDWGKAVEDAVQAANAGLDIEMPVGVYFGKPLKKAVEQGKVSEQTINTAVTHILRTKFTFIQDGDPQDGYDMDKVAGPEHTGLAYQVAAKGIVVLKNEDAILPLDPQRIKTVAVLGKHALKAGLGDIGSSAVTPKYSVSPLKGLLDRLGAAKVKFCSGGPRATLISKKADAVIVVTSMTYRDEGEGGLDKLHIMGDRVDLALHASEIRLIKQAAKVNPNVIVVLQAGSAVTMQNWQDKAKGVIMAWYPGMEGGHALADLILGKVNPSGKIPFAWPESLDQLPPFDNTAPEVGYGYYHGYRWFDHHGTNPLYPFGHGLSYTTWSYDGLIASADQAGPDGSIDFEVKVTNTGDRAGEEVVQLYVAVPGKVFERPVKDLKGFGRVALAPGESGTVKMTVKVKDLAYWCMHDNAWKVEPGEYTVMAGPNSADLPLCARFTVS